MPTQHTLDVALTKPLVRHIGERSALGHYATASEGVCASFRLLIEQDTAEMRRPRPAEQPVDD